MNIRICVLAGDDFDLPVGPSDTILDLKKKIKDVQGIKPERQSLYFMGYLVNEEDAVVQELMRVGGDSATLVCPKAAGTPARKITNNFIDEETFLINGEQGNFEPVRIKPNRDMNIKLKSKKFGISYHVEGTEIGKRLYHVDVFKVKEAGNIKLRGGKDGKIRVFLIHDSNNAEEELEGVVKVYDEATKSPLDKVVNLIMGMFIKTIVSLVNGDNVLLQTRTTILRPETPETSKTVDITYDSEKKLGDGCRNTKVFLGKYGNKVVAVKRIEKDLFKEISREATNLSISNHKNIVEYFGKQECGSYVCLALSLCKTDLARAIKDPSLCKLDVITILEEATRGIEFIHANGVAHRDIKPNNILIYEEEDGTQRVMISDFGLSKKTKIDASEFSLGTKSVCGTGGWMAPELMELHFQDEDNKTHDRIVSISSDIFSLGCVFFYTLTNGKHPFDPPISRDHNISKGQYAVDYMDENKFPNCKALIKKMISFNSIDRPKATDVLNDTIFKIQDRKHLLLISTKEKAQPSTPYGYTGAQSQSGHSSYFMESNRSDLGATLLRSDRNIRGKDWVKKIGNRMKDGRIKHDDVTVILSGTHGPVTALTDIKNQEAKFLQEDKEHIKQLKQDFPTHREIEIVNVVDYHQKPEKLKKTVLALSPAYIVFAFCKSNDSKDCTCDVKQLFLREK